MSILDQMRADQLAARKSNDKVKSGLLAVLIGGVTKSPPAKYLGKDETTGEDIYEKVETDLSDAKVVKTVKSALTGVEEMKAALDKEFTRVMGHSPDDGKTRPISEDGRVFMEAIVPKMQKADYEIAILNAYIPKQLSDDKLREIIAERKAAGDNMGAIMKHLKDNFGGLYDGGVASKIAKE